MKLDTFDKVTLAILITFTFMITFFVLLNYAKLREGVEGGKYVEVNSRFYKCEAVK